MRISVYSDTDRTDLDESFSEFRIVNDGEVKGDMENKDDPFDRITNEKNYAGRIIAREGQIKSCREHSTCSLPLEAPVTIASFPSKDRAAVSPVIFVDEAPLRLPGLDMMQVSRIQRSGSRRYFGRGIDREIERIGVRKLHR